MNGAGFVGALTVQHILVHSTLLVAQDCRIGPGMIGVSAKYCYFDWVY